MFDKQKNLGSQLTNSLTHNSTTHKLSTHKLSTHKLSTHKLSTHKLSTHKLSTLNSLTYTLIILVLFTSFCSVRTKPDRVWHLRDKIATLSKSLVGLPYKYGGDDIDGFDCSGLVHYVYSSFGIELPRTAKKQGKLKKKVKLGQARPGDILIFKLKRRRWHSGIFINKKYFVHAPNRKEAVREEYLNSYWRSRLRAVISVIDE